MFTQIKANFDISKAPVKPKVVYVSGHFNESMLTTFRKDMAEAVETEQTIIPIVIDSFGGHVYTVLGMMDIIKNCPAEVITIVNGKAMSAGGALFTCGKRRYCSPDSRIMIHEVSAWTSGKVEDLKTNVKESVILNKKLLSIMSKNIGKPDNYLQHIINDKSHVDWYLSATQAKKMGLATHIGLPTFTMNINAKYQLE